MKEFFEEYGDIIFLLISGSGIVYGLWKGLQMVSAM